VKKDKYGWLLIGLLMGMILGVLTWPAEAFGAEPVLQIANGQTVIDDISHPNGQEIDEAIRYLSENKVNVPPEIEALCIEIGKVNGICPELLTAICWKESRFQPEVINAAGTCHGLMQINKGCHKERMAKVGASNLYASKDNIRVGADYLKELFDQYEDVATVLEIYNGDGAAASDPERTSGYAQKVINIAQALERAHWK
jgi:soluble lytic murein transglycosylase-like protein